MIMKTILSIILILSLHGVSAQRIFKTIPDTVLVNDSFKLVCLFQANFDGYGSNICFFRDSINYNLQSDTSKIKMFFEYPQSQTPTLCIRHDTLDKVFNTAGSKHIIVEWLMRDTMQNIPYTTIGRDTLVLQVYGTTNLKENEGEAAVQLYPNPVQNRLHLKGNWQSLEGIIIRDVKGKVLYHEEPQASLDLTKLSSGIYFLQFTSQGKSWTEKFVKK